MRCSGLRIHHQTVLWLQLILQGRGLHLEDWMLIGVQRVIQLPVRMHCLPRVLQGRALPQCPIILLPDSPPLSGMGWRQPVQYEIPPVEIFLYR